MDIKVKRLLRDLSNPDGDLRALSAMTIMKLDFPDKKVSEEVVKALVKATQDKNVSVRFFARKAIDKIKKSDRLLKSGANEERDSVPLADRLSSESYESRLSAVLEISNKNDETFKDQLITMLGVEEHPFVKAAIVSALKLFITKEEADILSPFLTDPDNRVRSNTIEALEYLKVEEAIPSLFSALEDRDNRIRSVAAKALQSFGEEKVFTELKKMLESDEEWMKGSAIYALSHIQAGEAITMLIEAAKTGTHNETRLKAIIALANYHDLASFGFLKHLVVTSEGPIKEAAARSLKLIEEKFGQEAPMTTIVASDEPSEEDGNEAGSQPGDAASGDLTSTVTQFFRKGKDEAIGLSKKAAINFAVTDLKKQLDENFKEIGRVVFIMYQSGELEIPELLTIGHEILRMNFFIQKYTEQEDKVEEKKGTGFFDQLKNLFSKSAEDSKNKSQAEIFTKKREELLLRLGRRSVKKYEEEVFQAKVLEVYIATHQNLQKKLKNEQAKLAI